MQYDVWTFKDGEMVSYKDTDDGLDKDALNKLCYRPIYEPPNYGYFKKISRRVMRYSKTITMFGWQIKIGSIYNPRGSKIGIDIKSPSYLKLRDELDNARRKVNTMRDERDIAQSILRALK